MTEREDDDQELSDLAAIAPDAKLASEVLEIARQRDDDERPAVVERPGVDDASGAGLERDEERPRG
ncbi:MAG TPA: hypothetical protein VES19_14885 [Candidatus Limnocylindrales bacterium]|nr:hypothetical protein [Candidatus Limnocylindrales bacterium]